MDNLEELYCHSTKVSIKDAEHRIQFDYANGLIYAISNKSLIIYKETDERPGIIHSINIQGILKYVKYLAIYNIVFLATDNELILYDTDQSEIITSRETDNKILDLSWNHLETLFVTVDLNNDITSYTFTRNYIDEKGKISLSSQVPVPILVGWGSQKTQFQGPKQIRSDVSQPNTSQDLEVSVDPPKISWRGNSELFVVNYHQDGQRFLKVFDIDLQPLNMSEAYTNLQQPVAFMGQGQCIACCAIDKNGNNQLLIFEKNCRIKTEYDLPDVEGTVKKLMYHPLMNLLAISFVDKDGNGFINIYLFSNAQWFLKQQLYYPSSRILFDFTWLNLQENLFTTCKLVVFTSQDIEYHYFRFIINRCPLTGTVAVINGRNLELYLYDKQITPPPLYFCKSIQKRPINRVLFHPVKKYCICVDSFYFLSTIKITAEGNLEDLGGIEDLNLGDEIVKFHSVKWGNNYTEIYLINNNKIDIDYKLKGHSIRVQTLESDDKSFVLLYNDSPLLSSCKYLDSSTKYIYLTKQEVKENGVGTEYEFALSANRDFFVNDNLVCSGVTSVYVFEGYLIFTHSSAKLYCIRLKDHSLFEKTINLDKIFSRDIEQGAIIVACTNLLFPQIIFQLPRGNIETIGCKLITIDVIESMLKENKWADVLHVLRTEKVNWNVLIDLNPQRFLDHIQDFVKATKTNTMLSNIVTEFNTKENCFQTFYRNYSPRECNTNNYNKEIIVEEILNYLVSTDCINNLPSIVAIQQRHISLKSALKSIKDIFNTNKLMFEKTCSQAIKQLLIQEHFKDIEFAAYNLYDLDFLSLIYYNSNEDPKVYEPDIRSYRAMNPIERRFKMSLRGRNLKSSVKYLLRSDTVEDSFITNFVVKNRLEKDAYFSLDENHRHFGLVSELYANRLSIMQRYSEAGMVLKRAGLYKEALLEFKKGLDWKEVTSLCGLLNLNKEASIKLYVSLAEELVKAKFIDEAVIILQTYAQDYQSALNVLVDNNCFRKAICLAETYRETKLISDVILPKLAEYIVILNEKVNNYRQQFEMYSDRLKVVRNDRMNKLNAIAAGEYDDDEDLYPQTETGTFRSSSKRSQRTSNSRVSSMSSRNRRKEERKKIDLKQGGFYEDIALIRALHILYDEVYQFGNEVREICLVCHYGSLERGRELHKNLSDLQSLMLKKIPDIWSEIFIKGEGSDEFLVNAVIQNKQDLAPEYQVPPLVEKWHLWKLDVFSV